MKDGRADALQIRIVGHRRHWNRCIRVTRVQWRTLGAAGGLVSLLLAGLVYGLLATTHDMHPRPAGRLQALRAEVTRIRRDTGAGLDATAREIGVLQADSARLTAVSADVARAAGMPVAAVPVVVHHPSPARPSHLWVSLRVLTRGLNAVGGGERS